ncbi:HyaD/HybD family hydrogenase maturation endopeptidase [Desulfurobacterium atlanticum]|uniref:Hydrogenase maturation protease n=1 Tax=Desulfurobacterium atlanticum TaxID=240169 RepID=A0A238YF74_9BACT|nr:HyaD/HybD family hydrogenase maturation endopeptidase [Desulfurobacterium atlanticum]SNR69243.1 hydrogenase maturation protease [Desulfurobacterium atlanticum]
MEKIGIMGVGNILLGDEGFGVHFIERLRKKYEFPENVELIDGGTAGIFLSPLIDYIKKMIIIDVVAVDAEPGSIFVYDKEDFFIDRLPVKLSPHQIGLQEVLFLNDMKGSAPEYLKLIGIVPKSLDAKTELSPELESKMDEVEKLVLEELKKLGVEPIPKKEIDGEKMWWEKKKEV